MITVAPGITLCAATVRALAAAHIAQFSERIELKSPGTRVDDCEYYKALWVEIRTAINLGRELGTEHIAELYDAATSGDFDWAPQDDELRMVLGAERRASCFDRNCKVFPTYGGRGITVHSSWLGKGGFARFLVDVGPRPSSAYSLDRFPNQNGNYEPGNVRWATKQQQARNMRTNRLLTFQGETLTVAEWSERLGLTRPTIYQRLDMGWNTDRALSAPMRANRRREVLSFSIESKKACVACLQPKARLEFHADKRATDGRTSRCKTCTAVYQERFFDRAKANARSAAYRQRQRAKRTALLTPVEFGAVHLAAEARAS